MSSARALYAEPKSKLSERVQLNIHNFAEVASAIGKGGRAENVLKQARDNFVATEHFIHDSSETLKKLQLLHIHMNYQFEGIEKNVALFENLKEQAQAMRR